MNLMQPFRELVEKASTAVSDTFDDFAAKVNALWNIEHDAEGHHTDITADSVTTDSLTTSDATITDLTATTITTGSVTASGTVQADALSSRILAVAVANGSGTTPVTVLSDGIAIQYSRWSGGNPLVQVTFTPQSGIGGGIWQASTLSGTGGSFAWLDAAGNTILTSNPWATPTFNAGDYTASAGTWTLAAGDVTLFRYSVVGKTMTVTWVLDTTSVSGGQSQLRIKIPGGYTAANTAYYGAFTYNDNGAGNVTGGTVFTASGQTYIGLQLGTLGVSTWAASVNNTAVYGSVTFEVQ